MMPLFYLHTFVGWVSFFKADVMACRIEYQGEVLYVIIFMFALSMCFVFLLLLLCVMIPTWCDKKKRNRENREFSERFNRLRDDLTNTDSFNEGLVDHNNFEERE